MGVDEMEPKKEIRLSRQKVDIAELLKHSRLGIKASFSLDYIRAYNQE